MGKDFISELESFDTTKMKDVNTQEKIIMPTAEGLFLFFRLLSSSLVFEYI